MKRFSINESMNNEQQVNKDVDFSSQQTGSIVHENFKIQYEIQFS